MTAGDHCPRDDAGYCAYALYGRGCIRKGGRCPESPEENDRMWREWVDEVVARTKQMEVTP